MRRKNRNSSFNKGGGMKFSQNEKIKGKKNWRKLMGTLKFLKTKDVALDNQAPDCLDT